LGGEVIRIKQYSGLVKHKVASNDKRTQINGKFNDVNSADENK
jgi:hypothetical protein